MEKMELRPEDRGWNDPPIVNFNESNQSVKRGKLLNKRVAFPIHGGPSMGYPSMQTSSMQPQQMPVQVGQESYTYNSQDRGSGYYQQSTETYYPPQQSHINEYPQPNTHQSATYMQSGQVEQPQPTQYLQQNIHQSAPLMANDSMLQLDGAIRNFNDLMNNLSSQALNKDDVGKLLQVLQSMWREHKLTPEVQDMIFQFSVAIHNGDVNYAESLLSSLSSNHFQSCQEWISGPRALMQAVSSRQGGL